MIGIDGKRHQARVVRAWRAESELSRVLMRFANKKPAEEGTKLILKVIRDGTV
jgi:hypothetical protein